MRETGPSGHYRSQSLKHEVKCDLGHAFKRMQTVPVRVTNCCLQTVPHDWPGHREGSVLSSNYYRGNTKQFTTRALHGKNQHKIKPTKHYIITHSSHYCNINSDFGYINRTANYVHHKWRIADGRPNWQ